MGIFHQCHKNAQAHISSFAHTLHENGGGCHLITSHEEP